MKLLNKFSKGIIAVVLCLLLATTAMAVATVNYTATLDDAVLCVNELTADKTVTLTVKAGEKVAMDAFTAQVKAPEGWIITAISNNKLAKNFNVNLENGMLLWYADDAENVDNDLLATATIQIPAGTPAGEYEVEFEIIDISRAFGMPWEDGKVLTAKLTVCEHVDGDDADHLCDCCQSAIEGVDCVYVPGEAVWGENNTCTVVGTCACGKTATATASVTSQTTPGTCQTEAVTTYTATFTESWITEKTVTKNVVGEKDSNNHAGDQTTAYANNGENHTVTVTCGCGAVVSTKTADHDYTNGDCICGAAKPEEPSEPVTGLKGDVNLDGAVTSEDAVALLCHVLQATIITDQTALANGEVTNDGNLTSEDAVKILQYALKAIDSWD